MRLSTGSRMSDSIDLALLLIILVLSMVALIGGGFALIADAQTSRSTRPNPGGRLVRPPQSGHVNPRYIQATTAQQDFPNGTRRFPVCFTATRDAVYPYDFDEGTVRVLLEDGTVIDGPHRFPFYEPQPFGDEVLSGWTNAASVNLPDGTHLLTMIEFGRGNATLPMAIAYQETVVRGRPSGVLPEDGRPATMTTELGLLPLHGQSLAPRLGQPYEVTFAAGARPPSETTAEWFTSNVHAFAVPETWSYPQAGARELGLSAAEVWVSNEGQIDEGMLVSVDLSRFLANGEVAAGDALVIVACRRNPGGAPGLGGKDVWRSPVVQ